MKKMLFIICVIGMMSLSYSYAETFPQKLLVTYMDVLPGQSEPQEVVANLRLKSIYNGYPKYAMNAIGFFPVRELYFDGTQWVFVEKPLSGSTVVKCNRSSTSVTPPTGRWTNCISVSIDGEEVCTPPVLNVEIIRYPPANDYHDGRNLTLVSYMSGDNYKDASFTWLPGGRTGSAIEVQVGELTTYTATATITGSCEGLIQVSQTIEVRPPAPGLRANAGNDILEFCGTRIELRANTIPIGCTGFWRLMSGGLMSPFSNSNDPNSFFSGIPGGSYVLRWYLTDGFYTYYDDVNISFYKYIADAGPDQIGTSCGAVTLAGNGPDSEARSRWRIIEGAGGSIDDENYPRTKFSGIDGTTYILQFTALTTALPRTM